MEPIGFVAAMSQEVRPFLRRVGKWERVSPGGFPGYRFRLFDRDCLLVQSGIGLRRATDATQALVAATRPQLLVSFGVAGAVQNDLQVGDVVFIHAACLLDNGIPGQFQPLALWSTAARQAATQALQRRSARWVIGTAITTPGSQSVHLPPKELAHPVLEMETMGIAQVAAEQAIPLLALRAISDTLEKPIPFGIEEFFDADFNLRVGKIVKIIVRHPYILLHLLRLRRNIDRAAENAAIALVPALSHW
jgi:nucleoside phosphorylase